jgi:MFS transporter, DHA1 family, tetracycline resistance protein
MRATAAARHGRAAFAFIFVTVLIDMRAFGIIIPVRPGLIVEFSGGDKVE